MKIILLTLLVTIFVFVFIILCNKHEGYIILENEKKSQSSILPKTGIRQGSDPLDSNLFNDVVMYIGDRTLDGEIGLEKCIKGCDGMCVEYGLTGDAFCFPKKLPME